MTVLINPDSLIYAPKDELLLAFVIVILLFIVGIYLGFKFLIWIDGPVDKDNDNIS